MHHSSQAVTTVPAMTGSGSGWEGGTPIPWLCAGSILGTLRLTPYTTSQHQRVHQTPWWRILMEARSCTLLYSLGSLIPRPGDEEGGQETLTVLNHCKVHISPRAGSLVTTSTLRWSTLPCTCPHAITSPYCMPLWLPSLFTSFKGV